MEYFHSQPFVEKLHKTILSATWNTFTLSQLFVEKLHKTILSTTWKTFTLNFL